jgi:hypothetical protein
VKFAQRGCGPSLCKSGNNVASYALRSKVLFTTAQNLKKIKTKIQFKVKIAVVCFQNQQKIVFKS